MIERLFGALRDQFQTENLKTVLDKWKSVNLHLQYP